MLYIKVKTQFEGFHRWKEAPKDVKFLQNLHRHIFNVVVQIQVIENNRELEYFQVKKQLDNIINLYKKSTKETESCEMIAEFILDWLEEKYPYKIIQIEVSEDNENGSIIDNSESFLNL